MSSMTLSELFISQCDDQVHSPGNHLIKHDDKWSCDTYTLFETLRLRGLQHQEDERAVVTYNAYQLGTYHSFVDVEWCNSSRAITFVFKYVYRNPHMPIMGYNASYSGDPINLVSAFRHGRYICAYKLTCV